MTFKLKELEELGIFEKNVMDGENDFYLFCKLSNLEYEDIGLMAGPINVNSIFDDIREAEWEVTLFPYSHQIKTIEDIKSLVKILF